MNNYSNHTFVISTATTRKLTKNQIAKRYIMTHTSCIFPTRTHHIPGLRRRTCYIIDANDPHCTISLSVSTSMDCNIHRVNEPQCTTFAYKNLYNKHEHAHFLLTSVPISTIGPHAASEVSSLPQTQTHTTGPSQCASATTSNSDYPSATICPIGNAGSSVAWYSPA